MSDEVMKKIQNFFDFLNELFEMIKKLIGHLEDSTT